MTKLEELKGMCDLILEEKSHMDKRFKTLSDELTIELRDQYLHKEDDNYITYLHVNNVEASDDCISIIGIAIEYTTEDEEPSIWYCTTYIRYDELFNEWKVVSKEDFNNAWNYTLNLLEKTL